MCNNMRHVCEPTKKFKPHIQLHRSQSHEMSGILFHFVTNGCLTRWALFHYRWVVFFALYFNHFICLSASIQNSFHFWYPIGICWMVVLLSLIPRLNLNAIKMRTAFKWKLNADYKITVENLCRIAVCCQSVEVNCDGKFIKSCWIINYFIDVRTQRIILSISLYLNY